MIKKISIKNVNFGFNKKVFFKNLSIDFSTKGISVIIGPNGSGKSLITKLLKGIIIPDSGEIQLISGKTTPKISYLSQKITFLRRDVSNNLAYPLIIRNYKKKQIKQKVNKILKNFNFLDKLNFSARSLSKGNKQFLAFIRSQIIQYDILVLDEPCSNLDFESIKIIEKYLLSLKKNKKIIMVTHDMFQAMRLADEIIIVNNGELIEVSEKKSILKSKNNFTKNFFTKHIFNV
jgi:tungstate transport system ATP-binding protein